MALALTAVERATSTPAGEVRRRVGERASSFVPLRGRLTLVTSEERGGVSIRYVDDGLATSTLPTVAALEVFADVPVAPVSYTHLDVYKRQPPDKEPIRRSENSAASTACNISSTTS